MVEQLTLNQLVHGSSPCRGTNFTFFQYCRITRVRSSKKLLEKLPERADRRRKFMKTSVSISTLLHHKGSTVWHISPEAMVFDAIKLMAKKNIGALPVLAKGRLAGIFSERDYTRKIALAGKTSKQTLVKEILSAKVVSVPPEESVEECMRLMTEHRIRHLPVVQNDEVVGIISIGDLVNWIISTQDAMIAQMESYIGGAPTA
jgi:CBS domain-containing protein